MIAMNRDMYDMKHVLRYSLLVMAVLLCQACTGTDPQDITEERTTTIYLQLPQPDAGTRSISPGYEDELQLLESQIYTLRVILLSQAGTNKSTTINRLFKDVDSDARLVIENVPVGVAQLYVIANEASIGQDYSDIANLQKQVVDVNGSRKVLITDTGNRYFPIRGSELLAAEKKKGLPMSWMNKNLTVSKDMTIDVALERCVSKICMQIQNDFSESIKVTEVSFGAFFGNSFYLFREGALDVPDQTYKEQVYDQSVDYPIAPNESEVLICYFYPSFARTSDVEASPYTIGFKTEHGEYPKMAFLDSDGKPYNSIPRNKQININVTLSGATHVNIDFEVVEWTERTITVPDFE
ncbi:hypothetical protein BACCOPRO_00981 [Phocaeicola coprophilus DSM 18228 = JCM 13818]|uniref:Major fimbrial subunit protein N-terminal domain-containing protein n=2 Tax=Phocaeicola coprophilus TaxID=387090 RepID=S0F713_9BACT|nr:hypothetical protein BACCOPRO_00981 [Phocaeicola coprophilus DSM 18228 = JCM 13818]